MRKAMTILYEVHDNLYVNLTNRCPCLCTFCLRSSGNHLDKEGHPTLGLDADHSLWLEHEPDFEEIVSEFDKFDMSKYKQLVFCGYGEPTERLDVLLEVAKYAKETFDCEIRLNTNGLGNLINEKDITPLFENLISTISISLNTPNEERYHEIVRSKFGSISFSSMLDFAKKCTSHVNQVVLTTVDTTITKEEEQKCQEICSSIGATYRIRPFES